MVNMALCMAKKTNEVLTFRSRPIHKHVPRRIWNICSGPVCLPGQQIFYAGYFRAYTGKYLLHLAAPEMCVFYQLPAVSRAREI